MTVNAVTWASDDNCAHYKEAKSTLAGICIDLWNRTARDLNLTSEVKVASTWSDMIAHFQDGRADVILHKMTATQLKAENISE